MYVYFLFLGGGGGGWTVGGRDVGGMGRRDGRVHPTNNFSKALGVSRLTV